MYPNRKACVILLVGIPGSGKTFFRKFFENYLHGNVQTVLGSVQLYTVCYDDYEHMRSKWKQSRLDIIKLVGNLIEDLKSQDSLTKKLSEEKSVLSLINKELESPDSTVILIDDNMYYRSMRYEYYKLAKTNNISFSQIFFDVDLHDALKYNSKRSVSSRVPDIVIENMYRKLEPPQTNHLWEKFSVSIKAYADYKNQDVLSKILICVRSALDNPMQSKDVNSNKEETFHLTSSNVLHEIDNTLKQLVSNHIKSQISAGKKNDIIFTSKVYSEKRLKLLKLIKARVITLPIDLNEVLTKEKMNLIKPLLLNLLFSD